MALPDLQPLIISAPFGNYIQPAGTTPTLGTFTAAARPGRVIRILKTVRYYPRLRAWVNQIGLRNPGIDWLIARARSGKINLADKLVSIHGFTDSDWYTLLEKTAALKPLGIELNMSCPNVGQIDWPQDLFTHAAKLPVPGVVKLPPVNYHDLFAQSMQAGLRCYHCCNTLPVPAGGISGKPLKPVALQCIRDIRRLAADQCDDLFIIGGGGITTPADIDDYRAAGATRFAIGTKVFNPQYLFSHAGVQPLIQRATG
ncbi:MAG: hypothetical protein WC058_11395 [Phycisphaeraceae bacterium]